MTVPDPQTIADAVAGCPAVVGLSAGPTGTVATYRPGERIVGVRINNTTVAIHVIGRWDTPIPMLVEQIRARVEPCTDGRKIDLVVEDVGEPEAEGRSQGAI